LTEEPSLVAAQPETERQQDSVRSAFSKLYTDGRAYADAEIERQKLRAGIAGAGVRDAAIFATAGFMLAFAGLIAFLVGMVLMLSRHLGAGSLGDIWLFADRCDHIAADGQSADLKDAESH
jgi:hypothetical protein